jgi:hypothetical protein
MRIIFFMDLRAKSASRGSLFPSEPSSCDQATYNGTVVLAMDQHYEAMNRQGSRPDTQDPGILGQLACEGVVLLIVGAKAAQRTWSKYEQKANDIANRNRHCRQTPFGQENQKTRGRNASCTVQSSDRSCQSWLRQDDVAGSGMGKKASGPRLVPLHEASLISSKASVELPAI